MYNDEDSNIIFEVAPLYPGFFEENSDDRCKSYSEWLREYNMMYKGILPKDIALSWIEQLNSVAEFVQ